MMSEYGKLKKIEKPEGTSETISPYSSNFFNSIEKGILPLVTAFLEKGYLTYSSCEGHSIWGRRFIAFAFPNLEEANKFIINIKNLKQSLISFKIKRSVDYYHDPKYGQYNENGNTQWLNSVYLRGYKEYYFVELSLGLNSPPSVKNLGLILNKLINRDRVTKKLLDFVKSENFEFFKS